MHLPKRLLGTLAVGAAAAAGLNALLRSAARKREDVDPNAVDVPGSFIEIDGQRMHYVDAGQGAPVVLIHGWNGSTFSMRHVIPELARTHRVIAIDLLGYGYSARAPQGDYSNSGQAKLVLGVIDHLGVEHATVLGHSMGGGVALRLAFDAPQRVDKLVLVSTVTSHEGRRVRFSFVMRPFMPLAGLLVRESTVRRLLRRMAHDPAFVTQDVVDGYLRPLRVKGHLAAQTRQLTARRGEVPVDPHQVQQPTLIMWGEHDSVIPLSTGLELAEQMPHAQLAIVRSAGHLALEEQPDECNQLLLRFLEGPAPPASATSTNGVAHESASPVL